MVVKDFRELYWVTTFKEVHLCEIDSRQLHHWQAFSRFSWEPKGFSPPKLPPAPRNSWAANEGIYPQRNDHMGIDSNLPAGWVGICDISVPRREKTQQPFSLKSGSTVDGTNPATVDIEFMPLFTSFLYPRWCRISSINSIWQ